MRLPTTIPSLFEFFRSCTRSRLAWVFACLHLAWFLLAIANMSPPSPAFADFLDQGGWSSATIFAGRPFHFHYECIFLKLLLWVDVPSLLMEALWGLLSFPVLMYVHLSSYLASYFGAGFLLLIATCQWLMLGKAARNWVKSKQLGGLLERTFSRYFAVTIVAILLLTIVFVPLVNRRSQRLGFRHPAISWTRGR